MSESPNQPNFFSLDSLLSEALSGAPGNEGPDAIPYLILYKELDTGWPWPLDAVQTFFEWLASQVLSIARRVWDYFNEALVGALEWLWGNLALPLWRFAEGAFRITAEWVSGWPEPWRYVGALLLFPAAFTYKALRDAILPALTQGLDEVKRWFDGAVGGVFDAIRNAFSPIFGPLAKFADTIYKFLTEALPGWLKTAADFFTSLPGRIGEALEGLAGTITKALSDAASYILNNVKAFFAEVLPKALSDFAGLVREGMVLAFQAAWQWLNENVVPPIRTALQGLWNALSTTFSNMIKMFLDLLGQLREHIARGDLATILTLVLGSGASAFAIAAATDLINIKIAGTGIDAQAIRAQVLKILDAFFDPKMFTSVFAAIALQKPLEYTAKLMFRTELPPPTDLLMFYAKNWIDYETLREGLARHGFSDYWIDKYEKSVWQEPKFDQVFVAYKRGAIPREDYRAWLNILNILQTPRPGMQVPDVKIWEESAYRMPSPFVLAYAADTGLFTEEDIKRALEYELIHPQFVDLTAKALVERAVKDEKSLLRSYTINMYIDGVLSWPEAEANLRELNVAKDFLDKLRDLLGLAREKKLRSKAISYLERAFLDGYITREDFVGQLIGYGVDADFAKRYAMLLEYVRNNYYLVKETKDERLRYASLIEDMVAKGAMSAEDAYRELVGLGFPPAEVELRLRRARLAYENETMRIKLNDLIERIKQGLIDRRTFEDECVRIGYGVDRCREWGQYYWSKYIGSDFFVVTKDERNALANALLKLYVIGFMEEDELRSELYKLGFLDAEIDLRIRKAQVEDRLEMLQDLLAEADALLKKGLMSHEEYVEYLVSLGMRRDRAEARARRYAKK